MGIPKHFQNRGIPDARIRDVLTRSVVYPTRKKPMDWSA